MRLFVSIDLPDELAGAVEAVQAELEPASGLRFTDPTQAHLTLKFLGEVDADLTDDVVSGLREAVADAGVAPFEATVEGLGVFPELSYIRVVWVGIGAGADRIASLHAAVETALVARGFDPAEHAFTPHVTIARMDHAGGKDLVQRVVTARDPTLGTMTVDAVCLTESTLAPDGPVYETVDRVPLPAAR